MSARDPGERYDAAVALDAAGRSDEAAAALRELVADEPEFGATWAMLGTIEAIAHHDDAALQALLRAAMLMPDNGAIQNNLGNLYATMGQGEAALAAFDRSLELRPDHAVTLHNRGKLLRRGGRPDLAMESFDRAVRLDDGFTECWHSRAALLSARAYETSDPADMSFAASAWRDALARGVDRGEAEFAIAALGEGQAPATAPRFYVEGLFDRYADRFDKHLVEVLGYRTPGELCKLALGDAAAEAGLDVVDLGCGTGLCAPLLRPAAKTLVGVDLSEGMLEQARARGGYDTLHREDLVEHLAARPGAYDLAVSADVLVYIGDLAPLFGAAHGALRPGGRLAVSVEHLDGDGRYELQPTRRYKHTRGYVEATARAAGFTVETALLAELRREGRGWIRGGLYLLRR
jgi:predicted TPR repeat methyltransferase